MQSNQPAPENIDEYISEFPDDVQQILQQVRTTIKNAAPEAKETIKYRMPTFTLNGNLVYFAAFKRHIGFFPVPSGIEKFKKELSEYKCGKGSIQFPFDRPIPYDLIGKIVRFRVKENLKRASSKSSPSGKSR
jgi:uncharacterized protein YdhG (YjbR/CyaY superfamily)